MGRLANFVARTTIEDVDAGNQENSWKPLHFLNNVSASIGSVMKPASFENGQDIVSAALLEGCPGSALEGRRRNDARTLVEVLKNCGDNLTRANVMKQAASLKKFASGTSQDYDQHKRGRLRSYPEGSAHEVQGRTVGAVWRFD
jgi:hypothetical protein